MVIALNLFLLLCFAVICYTDFRWLIIPNSVNAALLVGGVSVQAQQGWVSAAWALAFALLVGTAMWSIRYAHHRLTRRVGLGIGDVKLATAAATWFSAWMFPFFLLAASSLALLFLLATSVLHRRPLDRRVPFGPFLAASLIVSWNAERIFGSLIGPAL